MCCRGNLRFKALKRKKLCCWLYIARWQKLKSALIDKRSRLGETQTLQQFSRDADEADAWVADKLQTATDDSYKDPSNIQVVSYFFHVN